jgi:hypothetical protein
MNRNAPVGSLLLVATALLVACGGGGNSAPPASPAPTGERLLIRYKEEGPKPLEKESPSRDRCCQRPSRLNS